MSFILLYNYSCSAKWFYYFSPIFKAFCCIFTAVCQYWRRNTASFSILGVKMLMGWELEMKRVVVFICLKKTSLNLSVGENRRSTRQSYSWNRADFSIILPFCLTLFEAGPHDGFFLSVVSEVWTPSSLGTNSPLI